MSFSRLPTMSDQSEMLDATLWPERGGRQTVGGFCWPGPLPGCQAHSAARPTLAASVAEPSLLAEPFLLAEPCCTFAAWRAWLHASPGRQVFSIGFRPGPSGLGSGTQTQTNQRGAVDAPFNWPRRHSCGISIGTIEIKTKVANCSLFRESGGGNGKHRHTGTQALGEALATGQRPTEER